MRKAQPYSKAPFAAQCDRCEKWRSAPATCVRGDEAPWFCEARCVVMRLLSSLRLTHSAQLNTGRFNASCAAAEDDYPAEEEHKYVVVGGDGEADAPPASYDEGGANGEEGQSLGRLVLRLKAPRRARAGPAAAPAPEEPAFEEVPPAPAGWTRTEVPRKTVGGSDVYYESPDGEALRSMPEVARWLAGHRDAGLTLECFSFAKSAAYGNKPPAGGSRRPAVSEKLRRIAAGLEEEREAGGGASNEAAAEHKRWGDACERMQPAMRAVIPALRALMAHPHAPRFSSPEAVAALPDYHLKVRQRVLRYRDSLRVETQTPFSLDCRLLTRLTWAPSGGAS